MGIDLSTKLNFVGLDIYRQSGTLGSRPSFYPKSASNHPQKRDNNTIRHTHNQPHYPNQLHNQWTKPLQRPRSTGLLDSLMEQRERQLRNPREPQQRQVWETGSPTIQTNTAFQSFQKTYT